MPSLAPFERLHFQHRVCKFSSEVIPPFDKGITWSISNNKCFSSRTDTWQILHANPSRVLIFSLSVDVMRDLCPATLFLNFTSALR